MLCQGYLLLLPGKVLVVDLLANVGGQLDAHLKSTSSHQPLVDEESWRNRQELLEVGLLEVALVAFLDHGAHSLERGRPHVVPLAMQAQVGLELLEQLQKVVEVLGQLQVEDLGGQFVILLFASSFVSFRR